MSAICHTMNGEGCQNAQKFNNIPPVFEQQTTQYGVLWRITHHSKMKIH